MKPVAYITGATRGIGLAIAKGLAKEGFSLSLAARSEELLNNVQAEIVPLVAKLADLAHMH